jgi:hypothetical protein
LPPAYLEISPGCLIRLPGDDRSWRVDQVTADSLAVVATLHPVFTTVANVSADSGRVLPSGAATASPTILDVIELPFSEAGDAVAPVVAVAASSSSGSWRAVPLHIEIGEMSLAAPTAPVRAVLGTAQTLLGAGQSTVFDQLNSIDVQLANPDQWLECRDDAALADGANLALVGSELIQFGDALPLGDGRFRLSRLLRGRRGSEWAMRLHEINETFVLLDAGKLVPVPMTSGHIGATIRVAAFGLADTGSEAATLIPTGEALRPPCPVHLRAVTGSDGSLRCTWVRRSRRGWAWLDGVDAPLDCSVERYRITLMGTSASTEIESNTPEIEIDAAEVSRLGAGIIQIDVVQVGDFAISRPATLTSSIS